MKFKIKSKKFKDKYIYGEISGVRGATTLVVFMSGFDGSSKFSLFKTATNYFNKNSVSTIRFDFCNKKNKDAILLQDISFSVYATELKNIIDRFGKNYLRIVFVGHSFGAVVAIMFLLKHKAFLKKTELVLWDPTLLPWKEVWMKEDYIFLPEKKLYRDTHTHELINKTFYKECTHIKNSASVLGLLKKDVLIIAAKGSADKDAMTYFSKLQDRKNSQVSIINNTDHYFKGMLARKQLLDKTNSFLKRK